MTNTLVERVARAIHDGPLCADDHDFDAPENQKSADWCREVAQVAVNLSLEEAEGAAKKVVEEASSFQDRHQPPSDYWLGKTQGALEAAIAIRAKGAGEC
jgi:hypothetical protein